jgi:hypothetical protein
VSLSFDDLSGSAFVRPNEARHIQTAFPAFAKRPGTPPPPEKVVLPGLLVQPPVSPTKILMRGGAQKLRPYNCRLPTAHYFDDKITDCYRNLLYDPYSSDYHSRVW